MKKILLSIMLVLFLVNIGHSAGSKTVRFPAVVSINSSAVYQTDTKIFVINKSSTPVTISFGYYNNEGVKGSCPIPSSITIQGNDTWTLWVGACFAVAIPMTPVNLVGIGEITAPSKSVSVYWGIYDVSGDKDVLMDHGKEPL